MQTALEHLAVVKVGQPTTIPSADHATKDCHQMVAVKMCRTLKPGFARFYQAERRQDLVALLRFCL